MAPRFAAATAVVALLAAARGAAGDLTLTVRYAGPSCAGAPTERTLFPPPGGTGCVALGGFSLAVRCDNATSGSQLLYATADCSGTPASTVPVDGLTPCAGLPDGSSHAVTCLTGSADPSPPTTGLSLTSYGTPPSVACAGGGASGGALAVSYVLTPGACAPYNDTAAAVWVCGGAGGAAGTATFYAAGSGCTGTPTGVQAFSACGAADAAGDTAEIGRAHV